MRGGFPQEKPVHFFRYTFSPIFSSRFGMVTLPSVEAMMTVLPDADCPNSFDRSTLIVSIVPSTVISTFFIMVASQWWTKRKHAIFQSSNIHSPDMYRGAGEEVN